MVKEMAPDLVVMEIVLAQMDGIEVLEELAKLEHRPKVLILSSFAKGSMAELAAAKGADHYMTKPCRVSTVCERIRQLTGEIKRKKMEISPIIWKILSPPSFTRWGCLPISRAISICGKPF